MQKMMADGFQTLVDCVTVSKHLGHPDWLICDTRHQLADPEAGEQAFDAGHLPGAVFLHLDRDLSGPMTGGNGRHPLPRPEALLELFGNIGIDETKQVLVYDDAGGMIAGRLWWLLRWMGHRRVALLDGGLSAWQAAGLPVVAEVSTPKPRHFKGTTVSSMRVSTQQVLENLSSDEFLLLDARSADRFRGENETLDPIGGHIPGASNRFFRDNLNVEGLFKSAAVLRSEYLTLLDGRSPEHLVHLCGSGVSACLSLMAMEHAGLPGSRLYPGSWSEWCSNHSGTSPRPVATGPVRTA